MAKDPYRYFRVEARELLDGLAQGVIELEKGTAAPDFVARLLRMAHTLKGAARVVKQPVIAELAHAIEGLLTGQRDTAQPLSKERGSEILQLLDRVTVLLQAIEPASSGETPSPAVSTERLETVRVEIQELDSLLRQISETTVQVGGARRQLGAASRLLDLSRLLASQLAARPPEASAGTSSSTVVRARPLAEDLRSGLERFIRDLGGNVERMEGGLGAVEEAALQLRLVPAHTVFSSLDRAVRDAAHALGKRVEFVAVGGDVRLDAQVLASLGDALMHVARNAVTHGIETEIERAAAGKSPKGVVRLTVARRGGRVSFACEDDGRGVDIDAVRRAAVERGLMTPSAAESLPAGEVLALLRAGGLTTSGRVTELSGRGIGLDVVRATASRLKGEMRIRSAPGHGATVELEVPVSIASMEGLVVEIAGAAVAIPLDAVQQTLRVRERDIARSAESDAILHDGKVVPFLPLDRALGRAGAVGRKRRVWSAVVVQAGTLRVAIGVDRLVGTSTVVMRSLPAVVEADSVISGASLDAEGNPQLVLDPAGLVAAAERGVGRMREDAAPARAPILVVDDSLTTRMLEQSILESAGYEVELAVSAEEGLVKARGGRHSLFIVDVEMPGMDGFEFVSEARADPALRDVPSILVTSRDTVEDRRRGEQAGARAYIVKGEFDQGKLLSTIRRLVG